MANAKKSSPALDMVAAQMGRDYEKPPLSEFVCSHCFRSPADCICHESALPEHLIVVDEGIQEHVRILNDKGYRTSYCCESHHPYDNLYVAFQTSRGLDAAPPLPEGFRGRKRGALVEHLYGKDSRARKKMTPDEFEADKAASLAAFLKWCEALPPLPEDDRHRSYRRARRDPEVRCAAPRGASLEETLANYECTSCGRTVTECEGGHSRWGTAHLMDRGIKPCMDALAAKKYSVWYGCAGHGPGSSVFVSIWPYFHVEEFLGQPPESFAMLEAGECVAVAHEIPADLPPDAAERDRRSALAALQAWCDSLPECPPRWQM